MILLDALILPASQLQIQKMMALQMRSHIKYSIETYIHVLIL